MAASALSTAAVATRVNEYECKLELNRYSVRGVVADYQIILPSNVTTIEEVFRKTADLFHVICLHYNSKRWKARLVALCEYERLNNEGEVIGCETYHHASYSPEWCSLVQAEEFYRRHLLRISSRIESFLRNGSSLRFVGYKHIHVAVSIAG